MRCYETSSHLGQRPSQPNGNKNVWHGHRKEKWNEKARKGHSTLRCILIEEYQFSIADGQGKQADTL